MLYVAAHPDDENTRLLAYLANERHLRTGYLSMTRGDGGQNLIGDDQGIDLGLVRTQELLAARRIDGAQQFFTRAFDFGYSKSPEEALAIWGHDKILADVVWLIRKFQPDIIITRFPTTGEGGHGHHTASAILAGEAFTAAADSTKFPEQLDYVKVWQAKRLLWNTFNFGGNNTTRDDQFKMDVGGYNAVLGKSYGEIAAESRSQHRSQGFGVAAQRGTALEYFKTIKGSVPVNDIMEGTEDMFVPALVPPYRKKYLEQYDSLANSIISNYDIAQPKKSLPTLFAMKTLPDYNNRDEVLFSASGIFLEAVATQQLNAAGDSMQVKFILNNRDSLNITKIQVYTAAKAFEMPLVKANENSIVDTWLPVTADQITQPYWLDAPLQTGAYTVSNQKNIGKAQNDPLSAKVVITTPNGQIRKTIPIVYKTTDPVKGEMTEPIAIVYPLFVNVNPGLAIFSANKKDEFLPITYTIQANTNLKGPLKLYSNIDGYTKVILDTVINVAKGSSFTHVYLQDSKKLVLNKQTMIGGQVLYNNNIYSFSLKKISYDHIPDIFYNYYDHTIALKLDLKLAGTKAAYIIGAGDKVPEAMKQMGYQVSFLNENDVIRENLAKFDVVVTGVRAYNIHEWLSDKYDVLMNYVKEGGVLVAQYNTNNNIGPLKAKISPYPFTISRNRVTDENATVTFLDPTNKILNYPNKITQEDFRDWVQERSIYQAENIDTHYEKIFSMADAGETQSDGSLLVTKYGKGKFVYTGLVFYRELPAAVPGSFRLFANLLAKPNP